MSYAGLLPDQGAAYSMPLSLDRDTQLRDVLGTALNTILPPGVVSGGDVTQTAALACKLASGTVLWAQGVTFQLGADLICNSLVPSSTNYLWATILRTAADQTAVGDLDAYSVQFVRTPTNTPPYAWSIPVAIDVTDGSGGQTINNAPDGKYAQYTLTPAAHTVKADDTDTGSGSLFGKTLADPANPGIVFSVATITGTKKLLVGVTFPGTVKVNAGDTSPDYLFPKFVAGSGIGLSVVGGQVRIANTDPGSAVVSDHLVIVSSGDSVATPLQGALVGRNLTWSVVGAPGTDQTLQGAVTLDHQDFQFTIAEPIATQKRFSVDFSPIATFDAITRVWVIPTTDGTTPAVDVTAEVLESGDPSHLNTLFECVITNFSDQSGYSGGYSSLTINVRVEGLGKNVVNALATPTVIPLTWAPDEGLLNFMDGGNAFGADAVFGTTDAHQVAMGANGHTTQTLLPGGGLLLSECMRLAAHYVAGPATYGIADASAPPVTVVDATGGGATINLPDLSVAGNAGLVLVFVRTDATGGVVGLVAHAGDMVLGSGVFNLGTVSSIILWGDGTNRNWVKIGGS